ncbi:DUF732 domain-containing protein [Mycolicibacter longobardus]|uniref:DUF732 domain-containing protein n=1 Tax=Mycolicibacter longobardus TaxID=1108812 RepID=UPI001056B1F1|nr:DUF732 domain-containing protein [Mycolicibacter longobardus]MCV7382402.1 hypothetical protein [Mycolicibacter longobardus]
MKSAILMLLVAAVAVCSAACGDNPTADQAATTTSHNPDPEGSYLQALKVRNITLRFAGEASDSSSVKYGRSLCDLARRKGTHYDPVPVIVADHHLSDEGANAVYLAAHDNFCPNVALYQGPDPNAPHPTGSTIPGDGKFGVSSEVEPGTYVSQPSVAGQVCVWSRTRDLSGSASSVIDQGVEGGPITVTILSTDGAFGSVNCQTWQKLS